jgi:hypothetical protein
MQSLNIDFEKTETKNKMIVESNLSEDSYEPVNYAEMSRENMREQK